jgi:hypothetical protein
VGDQFYKLKQAGIEAAQNAITTLIERIPSDLLNQGQALNNINNIRVHLASAQAELSALLAGPRSQASDQRITALRAEIQGVNSELGKAKSELITWKSLFLDAARSIVAALFEVEARMFAVLFVQKALQMFGGGGGSSGIAAAVQIAGEVAGGVSAATGGYITGPGTSTSDSIPARLSDGEYVVNAASVSRLGVAFMDAINQAGSMGVVRPRMPGRGYATGGLVTSTDNGTGDSHHTLELGMEPGLVLKHIESSEGDRTLLKWAERNSGKLRNLLSGR